MILKNGKTVRVTLRDRDGIIADERAIITHDPVYATDAAGNGPRCGVGQVHITCANSVDPIGVLSPVADNKIRAGLPSDRYPQEAAIRKSLYEATEGDTVYV
jgi:hypothetical protein